MSDAAGAGAQAPPLVPDLLDIEVPTGARVLVVSDLHLAKEPTAASTAAGTELAQTVESWIGPGVVILAGDCFELLEGSETDPKLALQSHGRFAAALAAFAAGENRQVVCMPGNHDGRLAWDERAVASIRSATKALMTMAVDLHIATGEGERVVRVEHGHQYDSANAFTDPRNPLDSPIGHHLVRDILPNVDAAPGASTWLSGVQNLDDPFAFPRFLASRLAYRRLGRHAWWLLLPFVIAVLLKVPLIYELTHHHRGIESWSHRLTLIGVGAVVDVILLVLVVTLAARRTWKALSGVVLASRGSHQNDRARDHARTLVTAGRAGLITGHTHHPELTHLGEGFYANTGCGTEVIDECPSRMASLGMPPVFLPHRELSWVELEAGAELHVRLLHSRIDLSEGTVLERAVAKRTKEVDAHPIVVSSYPHGQSWPPATDPTPALRRTRRIAASVIAVAGLLDLASAFYPPYRTRLSTVLRMVPLAVPQAATALVALAGLALLLLARSVRRGSRLAWMVSLALLEGSALLHLVKGVDLEEAVVALVAAGYLFTHRSAFRAESDRPSLRRGFTTLAVGAVAATVLSVLMLELFTGLREHHRLPIGDAFLAVVERLVGITNVHLSDRIDDFVTPALVAVGIGLALCVVWLALRPVVTARLTGGGDGLGRARSIVAKYGSGTLDYFALRSDKEAFFHGESMVAYAVHNAVCLVSPDPIGPPSERDRVWAAFRQFADSQGWILAVMGAGEEWLPTYREAGMLDLYVGDEAVVDLSRFSLDGGRNKGLRQAVNRIAKYGYTISFHDPATADAALKKSVQDVMTKSRRGDVERGFSMTLGRIFDPDDHGLLLAVASDPNGEPVAFCQYVPAPGIHGYSLDLMRRDDGEHPNGLLDFVVVETIRHLKAQGMGGLGLNFATMRAVLAGESGDSLTQRVERWLLKRMSGSMQIESLWRFNAKFDPDWQPRYAVYDAPEHAVAAAIAVARAESFWELPIIGRFLKPEQEPEKVPADL